MLFVTHQLRREIENVLKKISFNLSYNVNLQEYIVLPEAGQHIVLRFSVKEKIDSLLELDILENRLKDLAGENFWAVLVGDSFKHTNIGVLLPSLSDRLIKLSKILQDFPLPISNSPYVDKIKDDAEKIRNALFLKHHEWIWEIEVPWDDATSFPYIRIISRECKGKEERRKVEKMEFLIDYLPQNNSYITLVKAYILSRKENRSLLGYIFRHT